MYIFDLHNDTVHKIGEAGLRSLPEAQLDLTRMRDAGYALACFAAFVNAAKTEDAWVTCTELLDILRRELIANHDIIAPVLYAGDVERNMARGVMSALLTVEEGGVIGGQLSRIDELYARGVRMMTFTWNYDNDLSTSVTTSADGGLSPLGYDFLAALEARRIIADVSHISDAGFYDVAKAATRPFVASHSNARAICGHRRNLTDDMIRMIGSRGGLIGLNFCTDFIGGSGDAATLALHAREIADCGGIECLALGGDLDGIERNPHIPDCTAVPAIAEALMGVGFTAREAELVMGGNARRFFAENL